MSGKPKHFLDHKRLYKDYLILINGIGMTQQFFTKKYGISNQTLYRVRDGETIDLKTLFILLDFLEYPVERYIKTKNNERA